ncbi:MAG: electron transfer flavoprotein subunit alpha/FixB family protein, partial [Victivallales bacterium]|nr:electron transfer flavoprotein subunit alpha/FixB family protein [Victivallales bacterium]
KGYTVNFDTESLKLISGITLKDFFPDEEKSCVTKSQIVVAVGRGIKKPDNLPLIYKFAEKINAAVGATREVVDRGWMDYSHQIGLSGKTITPKLYIGIGISGAIQHLAGMQTAKNIIAVNSDPNANIFNIANVGIIGDLFEVLPTLTKEINRKNEL